MDYLTTMIHNMKRLGFILTLLLFISYPSWSQLPANRTSATKIADLLAMQPSEDKANFTIAMKEMEGFSKEDFSLLLQGLLPPDGKNDKIEYASNSYSFYVLQAGKETLRKTYAEGLLDALERVSNKDNKAYILQLLQQCAKDEAVDGIYPYLFDEYMAEKAGRALDGIRSESAVYALSKALDEADNAHTVIAVVAALGDLKSYGDESKIISQLGKYNHPELEKTVLFALSKIGGTLSQKIFEQKLKQVNYQYDNTNAAGAAINYALNLYANGNKKNALSFLNKLYKNAGSANAFQTQAAALEILSTWNPDKATKNLLKAANSNDARLREVGLSKLGADQTAKAKLLKSLAKATPEVQESILFFLAEHGMSADIAQIKPFVNSDNLNVRLAAMEAVHNISEQRETQFLIDHLGSGNAAQDAFLKHLILSTAGDPIAVVNSNLASADDAKKLVLLDILTVRRNNAAFDVVYPLTKSANGEVRKKAFQVLVNLSTDANVDQLLADLDGLSGDELKNVQNAIVASLAYSNKKEDKIRRLSSLISRSSAPSAANFFPIFAGLGGEEALKAVSNYSHSPLPELKSKALEALANWKNAEALPILIGLYKEDQNNADFDVVYKGLIRQINVSDETLERKSLYLRDAFEYSRTIEQKTLALSAMQNTGTYQSLVFASQFLDDKALKSVATRTAMNIAMDHPEYYGSTVRAILEKVMGNLSGSEGLYLHEAIVRHLAGMPQEEGFVSLFNGKDLSGWKGLVDNPIKRRALSDAALHTKQQAADKVMKNGWGVINGELVFNGTGDNIATIKEYGDIEMLVDWKLDKEGKEGDAGVYLRGTPQVQIWDISRTDVGAEVGSGGLYNNRKSESKPLKVADNPLGEWNTFKIRMVGDKVTVYLNGELVTDNVPLENYWDRNQSIFPSEQIELQAHGNRVYYRDIFIKELTNKKVFELSQEEKNESFEFLFDGTHLNKWAGSDSYSINEYGELWVNPETGSGGNFYTKEEYGDFVFRFEFKLTEGANNGVGIRTPLEGDAAYVGMEVQILDDGADVYKKLEQYQYHGSVYGVIAATRGALNPVGQWNTEEIYIKGDKIKVTVNGKVILDGDLKEATKNGTLDGKSHPGLNRKAGHIAFLGHGSKVFFRNIRVKKL